MTDRGFGLNLLKSLRRDESGAVLPLVAVVLTVMIGGAAMALDVSRLYTMQSSLQKAADAYALAAAAELDGRTDAITRANAAITMMNARNKAEGVGVGAASVIYYPGPLPATDNLDMPISGAAGPIPVNPTTAQQATARYVQVRTQSNLTTAFPLELVGLTGTTITSGGVAVAGYTFAFCRTTPLYVCNRPNGKDFTDPSVIGYQVILKTGPSNGENGSYGYLAINGNGANDLRDAIGGTGSDRCYISNGVDKKQGNVDNAMDAYNSRFDIYSGAIKPGDYPPDVNVRKGVLGNNICKSPKWEDDLDTTELGAKPFPFDAGLSYDVAQSTAGNGIWSVDQYWAVNHPGSTKPTAANCADTGGTYLTRKCVYDYEVANGMIGDNSVGKIISGKLYQENGTPYCSTLPAQANRRIIYAAVIDCPTASNSNIPVLALAKFFVTHPSKDKTIIAEYAGIAFPNSSSNVFKDIVQLYR